MAIGPGKYDDVCTLVQQTVEAKGVFLIVLEGNRGSGFSAQCAPEMIYMIPKMLEDMADQISTDLGEPNVNPSNG